MRKRENIGLAPNYEMDYLEQRNHIEHSATRKKKVKNRMFKVSRRTSKGKK